VTVRGTCFTARKFKEFCEEKGVQHTLTDIPTNNYSMTAMLADDTAILATDEDQQTATDQLQRTINNVSNWTTKRWKIKINSDKSLH